MLIIYDNISGPQKEMILIELISQKIGVIFKIRTRGFFKRSAICRSTDVWSPFRLREWAGGNIVQM